MPRDGSGNYTQPSGTTAVTDEIIASASYNTLISDIASALTDSVAADGQTTMTGDLPMGGNEVATMGVATARTSAARASQIIENDIVYVGDITGTDTYVAADNGFAFSAWADGMTIEGRIVNANTGAATLNFDGIGAVDIVLQGDIALAGGEYPAGYHGRWRYSDDYAALVDVTASTILLADKSPQLGGPLDTNSQQVNWSKGADVASAAALTLGTDGNYFDITGTTAITSIGSLGIGTVVKLHFDGVLTLTHNATDLILPGAANITTAAGDEAEFIEYASGDWRCTNYQVAADSPGFGGVFSESFTSAEQTITGAGSLTLAHGLSAAPTLVQARLICKTAELNYSVNDELIINPLMGNDAGSGSRGLAIVMDSTNINIRFGNSNPTFKAIDKTSGNVSDITNANWRLIINAWA